MRGLCPERKSWLPLPVLGPVGAVGLSLHPGAGEQPSLVGGVPYRGPFSARLLSPQAGADGAPRPSDHPAAQPARGALHRPTPSSPRRAFCDLTLRQERHALVPLQVHCSFPFPFFIHPTYLTTSLWYFRSLLGKIHTFIPYSTLQHATLVRALLTHHLRNGTGLDLTRRWPTTKGVQLRRHPRVQLSSAPRRLLLLSVPRDRLQYCNSHPLRLYGFEPHRVFFASVQSGDHLRECVVCDDMMCDECGAQSWYAHTNMFGCYDPSPALSSIHACSSCAH